MNKIEIGIGLLLDSKSFNHIREIEDKLALASNNYNGLYQPPHITIKRPFVTDKDTLRKIKDTVTDYSKSKKAFKVDLKLYGNFNKAVLFAEVKDIEKIYFLHEELLRRLEKVNVLAGEFDAGGFVPHSTLAMNLSPKEFETSKAILSGYETKTIKAKIIGLGIFQCVDEKHWIIVHKEDFNDQAPTVN